MIKSNSWILTLHRLTRTSANSNIGSHEQHNGSFSPARPPMMDFQNWTNQNELIHLPTRGASFTWDNGRMGRRHTNRRLDRSVCNQKWLDFCSSISCSTLTKTGSDHYPLLQEFKADNNQFSSSFKFLKMWSLHDGCKDLILNSWNETHLGCPMFILSSKLRNLKNKLKICDREVFGNVHQSVENADKSLSDLQHQIQLNGHSTG